jgi:hypothetical protein
LVNVVSAVMLRDFATNMQNRLDAYERGVSLEETGAPKAAGGFGIALKAAWMALARVARRFFLPYEPSRV